MIIMNYSKYRNILNRFFLFVGAFNSVLRARILNGKPFFISHLITSRCFARCPTCLWRGDSAEEMDTSKIIEFYRQARQLGFVSTTFWGGEPLLREDISDILKACKRFGFVNGLITNGYLLPQYANQIANTLDFLIVSIDFPSREHDRFRGVYGLFDNALKGIRLIKASSQVKIFLNTVVSRANYRSVSDLVKLAEELNITITFESVETGIPQFLRPENDNYENLRLERDKERQVFATLRSLKVKHRCINNSYGYLDLFISDEIKYRCHSPKICIRVNPDGHISNCLNRKQPIGNVYQDKLRDLLKSKAMKQLQRQAEKCSFCVDSGVIESSLFWEFNPQVMLNALRYFLR